MGTLDRYVESFPRRRSSCAEQRSRHSVYSSHSARYKANAYALQGYINDAAGNGLASVRLFTPCDNDKVRRIHL